MLDLHLGTTAKQATETESTLRLPLEMHQAIFGPRGLVSEAHPLLSRFGDAWSDVAVAADEVGALRDEVGVCLAGMVPSDPRFATMARLAEACDRALAEGVGMFAFCD